MSQLPKSSSKQNNLVTYILDNPNMSKPVELLPILDILHKEICAKNFEFVNDSLIEISCNLETLSPTAMVSIARYTFIVRENLNAWKNYVSAVSDRLDELNLDTVRILRGLI